VTKNDDVAGSVKTILSLISGIHVPSHPPDHPTWNIFWEKLENSILEAPKQNKNLNKMVLAYEVD